MSGDGLWGKNDQVYNEQTHRISPLYIMEELTSDIDDITIEMEVHFTDYEPIEIDIDEMIKMFEDKEVTITLMNEEYELCDINECDFLFGYKIINIKIKGKAKEVEDFLISYGG